jgi:hypothetical protein
MIIPGISRIGPYFVTHQVSRFQAFRVPTAVENITTMSIPFAGTEHVKIRFKSNPQNENPKVARLLYVGM